MALTPLVQKKSDEYFQHCLVALDFLFKNDAEHALGDFRKSAEAFMKILILKKFGDSDGERIILGEIDHEFNSILPAKRLDYQDFLDILKVEKLTSGLTFPRLIDLQKRTNPSVHNPNQPTNFEADLNLCKAQSLEITKVLYQDLTIPVPVELEKAYQGLISSALIATLQSSPWENLLSFAEGFSRHQKYLLIAPPKFGPTAVANLSVLSRIEWSFILDFDPLSKESGLYKAFDIMGDNSFVPLTIKQRGQRNLVGAGSYGNINWFFANGLKSIPDTTAANIRSWRSQKYHTFLKDLFTDFFSKEVSRYTVIYLWDDIDFLEEITRVIAELDEVPLDLVKHIFLSKNPNTISRLHSFDKYEIQFEVFDLSNEQYLNELTAVLVKRPTEKPGVFVPARTKSDENAVLDISDIHQKLLDDNIVVIHEHIEQIEQTLTEDRVPPFYQGEQVTWKDLSVNIEAERNKYEELQMKLTGHLQGTKKSLKFELFHKPGAGGTTLAHRIAFDQKNRYPVILITKYDKASTYNSLYLFLNRVNRTALGVVEASNVGLNDLEDLIRSCNASKLNICFLYIRRSLTLKKGSEFSVFLNDALADINERNRFVTKANQYMENKTLLKALEQRPPNECEVIDFPLVINEKEYSSNKILDYIRAYLAKLPEEQVRFCVFISIIYYYSQKPVSEIIFRSLFKISLTHELRRTPISDQFIRKLLIQEYDQQTHSYKEYWRPRFSKFAEGILMSALGGAKPNNWKDHVDLYAGELIKSFKENNEYLVEETRGILKGLFFERNNEDLLGTAEQWNSPVDNDQFSYLLRDVADKQKQKALLVALVENYSDENHFLGHLGRFLYEKAEEESEFVEAEKYIKQALDTNYGEDDYNLQHLGGMCFRRHLEFLKRNYRIDEALDVSFTRIIELGDEANTYFNRSRELNPYNVHAYVAQIQTLILVIDLGKEISGAENKELFIVDAKNRWFLEQLSTVRNLIDQAQGIVEQQETLGKTNKTEKAKNYIRSGEGHYYEALGNFDSSVALFQKLIETVDRNYRPAMRRMFIQSSLLRKVKGNRQKIDNAWGMLRDDEIKLIEKTINDDILQDAGNIYSLRLWFKLVRYSNIETPLEEIISRLQIWYSHSDNSQILKLESAFYLYVLHALIAIRLDSISQHHKNEANTYIKRCVELSKNTKHTYEYLGKGYGIESLISHRERGQIDDDTLDRIKGTIAVISSRQTGRITLPCGLEAFFVPYAGNFIQGIDETAPVDFQLGFRHDGLFAIDVKRIDHSDQVPAEKQPVSNINPVKESINSELGEELEDTTAVEEIKTIKPEQSDERYILRGPKVVGKIDLSTVYDPKKRKK